MKNNNIDERNSIIFYDSSNPEEGKEILMENYKLKEKLENLQKLNDNEKFENNEKIKRLENKVFHLKSSLNSANETIQVLKNIDNQEDSQIKEMLEKMRQKIDELENLNISIKKENYEFLIQIEKLKPSNNINNNNNDNNNFNIENKENYDSFSSNISFTKKTPEEIKDFFKTLKREKETYYENAVNIITENEIEIESLKNANEELKNMIEIYGVKFNLLKKVLKKKINIDLPNLEEFEEYMIDQNHNNNKIKNTNSFEYNSIINEVGYRSNYFLTMDKKRANSFNTTNIYFIKNNICSKKEKEREREKELIIDSLVISKANSKAGFKTNLNDNSNFNLNPNDFTRTYTNENYPYKKERQINKEKIKLLKNVPNNYINNKTNNNFNYTIKDKRANSSRINNINNLNVNTRRNNDRDKTTEDRDIDRYRDTDREREKEKFDIYNKINYNNNDFEKTSEKEINEYKLQIENLQNILKEVNISFEEKIEEFKITIENLELEKNSLINQIEKNDLYKINLNDDIEYYTQTARHIQEEKEKLEDILRNKIDILLYEKNNLNQTITRLIETNHLLEKEINELRDKNYKSIASIKEFHLKEKSILSQKCAEITERYFESCKSKENQQKDNFNLKQMLEKKKNENEDLIKKLNKKKEKKRVMNENLKMEIDKIKIDHQKNILEYQLKIKSLEYVIENKFEKIINDMEKIKSIEDNYNQEALNVNKNSISTLHSEKKILQIKKKNKLKISNFLKSFKNLNDMHQLNKLNKDNINQEELSVNNLINQDKEKIKNELNYFYNENIENVNDFDSNIIDIKNEDLSNLYGIDINLNVKKFNNSPNENFKILKGITNEFSNSLIDYDESDSYSLSENNNQGLEYENEYEYENKNENEIKYEYEVENKYKAKDQDNQNENKIKKFKEKISLENALNLNLNLNSNKDHLFDLERKIIDFALENEMLKKEIYELKEKNNEFKALDNLLEIKNLKEKNLFYSQENKTLLKEIDMLKVDLENLEISKADYINKLNKDLDITKDFAANAKFALGQISFDKDVEILKLKNLIRKLNKKNNFNNPNTNSTIILKSNQNNKNSNINIMNANQHLSVQEILTNANLNDRNNNINSISYSASKSVSNNNKESNNNNDEKNKNDNDKKNKNDNISSVSGFDINNDCDNNIRKNSNSRFKDLFKKVRSSMDYFTNK
jgi:hypothetical protein